MYFLYVSGSYIYVVSVYCTRMYGKPDETVCSQMLIYLLVPFSDVVQEIFSSNEDNVRESS